MNASRGPVIAEVLAQHAGESAFQWLLRDAAVHAPHYRLSDLVDLDMRVEAHVDGLRVAGEPGWEICEEELAWEEAGEVFTAGVLAFETGDERRVDKVVEAGTQSEEVARGLASSLGWVSIDRARSYFATLLGGEVPLGQRVAVMAAAIHRVDPGQWLSDVLTRGDCTVHSRALRAVGELGRLDLVRICEDSFADDNDELRFWAAWSATLLGGRTGCSVLRDVELEDSERSDQACELAVRSMPQEEALQWQQQIAERGNVRRALWAAGAIGDPVVIPMILDAMGVDEVARPAGEAFSFLTGVDLGYEDLEGEWPEGFEAGPSEDPEDEDVTMDPDEDLPLAGSCVGHQMVGGQRLALQCRDAVSRRATADARRSRRRAAKRHAAPEGGGRARDRVAQSRPAAVQRLCARRPPEGSARPLRAAWPNTP